MNQPSACQWNEMQQVGTDYTDLAEVERYERRMGEFRDLPAEDAAILAALALPHRSHILEIGTGSGHFARAAARVGHRVTAVDVSLPMLRYAENAAAAEGLSGIEFCHAGFLSFVVAPGTFDAAVSVAALHHLPDIWKVVAMNNIRRALKRGGQFFLCDVVFSSQERDPRPQFEAFVTMVPQAMQENARGHIAREFSTLDWIMEGLLKRAGFAIERIADAKAPLLQYFCRAE